MLHYRTSRTMFVNRVALASVVAGLVALLACTLVLSAGTVQGSTIDQASSKSQTVRLTKLLDEVRRLSELNRLVELKVQGALLGPDGGPSSLQGEQGKRETSWDMDYGWGGGRFGKRMDSLGIAGRFGRSVNDDQSNH